VTVCLKAISPSDQESFGKLPLLVLPVSPLEKVC
jgi:hypothetical protein